MKSQRIRSIVIEMFCSLGPVKVKKKLSRTLKISIVTTGGPMKTIKKMFDRVKHFAFVI